MNYLKNYDKKEIKLDPNFTNEEPKNWKGDRVKQLGSCDYPIDKSYKIIN